MRAFFVLVVCTFATTIIDSCESLEHQARVADLQNRHSRHHSAWKTVEENKAKVSTVSSEEELPGSNVNPEEIVQKAKLAAKRAKMYPKSLEEWDKNIRKKMAAQKAGEKSQKTTQQAEVASPIAHSQDREEMKVNTASLPSMTFDEWEKKFDAARKFYMNRRKNNQQQTKIAASPVKVYSESMKDLVQEQKNDEGVKIASPRHRQMPYPHYRHNWAEKDIKDFEQELKQQAAKMAASPNSYPHYPSTVETGEKVKEATLQREREKIMQRYNDVVQNAMMLNHDDVKDLVQEQEIEEGVKITSPRHNDPKRG